MTKSEFKDARKRKGMKQKELAAYLGVTLSAVQKWETGANKIPSHVVDKLNSRPFLTISKLSAKELADMEQIAASKGMTPDEYGSELIRSFLKVMPLLLLGAFCLFHVSRTPKAWNAAALKATASAAWGHVQKIAR